MQLHLTYTNPATNKPLSLPQIRLLVPHRPQRILDFDIENRPLSYLGSDFTTAEVTAIAWAWVHDPENVIVRLLGEDKLEDILDTFLADYEQADLVIGHYIRGHDLPMLNGALMEQQMPPLPDKWTHDTKLDLMRSKGLSLSQESLGAMWRLEHQKEPMNQALWRSANRLTEEGIQDVSRRVKGDVRQHIELYGELQRLGYLAPAREWKSGSARAEAYVP